LALLLQALSATAKVVRKAPDRSKHSRMEVPFAIPMAGPHMYFTGKIASNTQRDFHYYGATSSEMNRQRIVSSPPAAIRPCSSTSRKGTGCRYTERHYREICHPWRCAFTRSASVRAVIFQMTCPATRRIPSSLWRSSLLPGLRCCFVVESWRDAQPLVQPKAASWLRLTQALHAARCPLLIHARPLSAYPAATGETTLLVRIGACPRAYPQPGLSPCSGNTSSTRNTRRGWNGTVSNSDYTVRTLFPGLCRNRYPANRSTRWPRVTSCG
jgi:hypothetical protein